MRHDPVKTEDTQAWLVKAAKDIRAASIDLNAEPPLIEDVLFHCQQAVEKSMKAFLVWHDIPFRKTHDLVEMGSKCVELEPTLEELFKEVAPLTEYAWKYRYPGYPEIPEEKEAEDSLDLVHEVFKSILKYLPEETHPPKNLFE